MKKFYYVILLCNIFFEYSFAQAIDFSKLSLGLGGNYYITSDDMKEYWGNFPAATIRIKYSLRNNFELNGGVAVSIFSAKAQIKNLPDITFVDLYGGIGYKLPLTQERISLQLGIVNDVFSFEEGAAELISENDIEQEVGFYLGIDLRVIDGILLDKSYLSVNAKYSQIFSQPENLKFISIGLVYYLF